MVYLNELVVFMSVTNIHNVQHNCWGLSGSHLVCFFDKLIRWRVLGFGNVTNALIYLYGYMIKFDNVMNLLMYDISCSGTGLVT